MPPSAHTSPRSARLANTSRSETCCPLRIGCSDREHAECVMAGDQLDAAHPRQLHVRIPQPWSRRYRFPHRPEPERAEHVTEVVDLLGASE